MRKCAVVSITVYLRLFISLLVLFAKYFHSPSTYERQYTNKDGCFIPIYLPMRLQLSVSGARAGFFNHDEISSWHSHSRYQTRLEHERKINNMTQCTVVLPFCSVHVIRDFVTEPLAFAAAVHGI
jgi:hypothetical protein